jgi:hypothetical protein
VPDRISRSTGPSGTIFFGRADLGIEGHRIKTFPAGEYGEDGECRVSDDPREATEKVELGLRETRSEVEDVRDVVGVE